MRMLVMVAVLLSAAFAAAQEAAPPDQTRIRQLIDKLSDDSFMVREAAQKELMQFADYAAEELAVAAKSKDLEQARRAKQILSVLHDPNLTHRVVDALGRPIRSAPIVIKQGDATRSGFTDRMGRFAVIDPKRPKAADIVVEVRHADYGIARWQSGIRFFDKTDPVECKMPLVPKDSEARLRSVRGTVVDGHGNPVRGAVLHCPHVRTQGEGLLTAESKSGDVITDDQGRFALYLVANQPTRESKRQGDMVPPGAAYQLQVTAAGRDDCFPVDDLFANDAPLEIRMPLATRRHEFRFAQAGGGELSDLKDIRNVIVEFYPKADEPHRVRLSQDDVEKGRKLVLGKYMATHYRNGDVIRYLPLRVTADSPEILAFQLPPATLYRGAAVHGVTAKPMGRVWAAAITAVARGNLAELTDDDWRALRAMPDVAGPKDPAAKILGAHYGIGALVRTGDDGRFEIREPPGTQFYNIMVFAENFLPIAERIIDAKRERGGVFELGELPLFPAAKLSVKVVSPEKGVNVMPIWRTESDNQPAWFAKFRDADDPLRRRFYYDHWMTLDQDYPVFIPSGLTLRVEFRTSKEQWGPATSPTVQAKQGEVIAAGPIRLPKSLPVTVRIVDNQGKPIEGLSVRSRQADHNVWSLAHNTDEKGLAHLFMPRHSKGIIRVELARAQGTARIESVEKAVQIDNDSPESPFEIRLTLEQVRMIPNHGGK